MKSKKQKPQVVVTFHIVPGPVSPAAHAAGRRYWAARITAALRALEAETKEEREAGK